MPAGIKKRPGRAAQAFVPPRKQNGSWCRHQPPLVPGPTASPVRAGVFPGRVELLEAGRSQLPGSSGFRPRSCDLGRSLTSTCQANLPVTRLRIHRPKAWVSAGSSKKVGSAEASRFFFDDPTIASVACVPKDAARFRGGRGLELSSVAGSPLLIAKHHHGGPNRFAKAESRQACLWITGKSWISRPPQKSGISTGSDASPVGRPNRLRYQFTSGPVPAKHNARGGKTMTKPPIKKVTATRAITPKLRDPRSEEHTSELQSRGLI